MLYWLPTNLSSSPIPKTAALAMLILSKKEKRINRHRMGTTRISIFLINADSSMFGYNISLAVPFASLNFLLSEEAAELEACNEWVSVAGDEQRLGRAAHSSFPLPLYPTNRGKLPSDGGWVWRRRGKDWEDGMLGRTYFIHTAGTVWPRKMFGRRPRSASNLKGKVGWDFQRSGTKIDNFVRIEISVGPTLRIGHECLDARNSSWARGPSVIC